MMLATLALAAFSTSNAIEAARLTNATIAKFYDPKGKIWKPAVASAESVGTQGYTFWPSLLAWQSIIEAAKIDPKHWKSRIGSFYAALERYYDPSAHAYCAWIYFPGNDDHFYDDNAWAAIALMEAYNVTAEARYRSRAVSIFEGFVKGGWDTRGGLRWGTKVGIEDRKDRTVSATAAGALAALLTSNRRDVDGNRAWAKRALDWVRDLSTPEGLIQDGLKNDGTVMPTVWTYNTGVPIRAALEYARETGDRDYRVWAVKMGDAALDRSLVPLFDDGTADLSKRYWFDGTYFVHYLVDGLRSLSLATKNAKYLTEARREADYIRAYLRDGDGLYWRNMRLWKIDTKRDALGRRFFGPNAHALEPDPSERSQSLFASKEPIEKRPMVKTLLANAGAARMFWLLAH